MSLPLVGRRRNRPTPDAMTLVEHLTELRRRVVTCALAFAAGATVAFVLYNRILIFLREPYCRVTHPCGQFYVTGPLDGLSFRMKVAAYGAVFLASPVVLWQVWRFVTPGLERNEKRYAIPFVTASISLFLGGAALAYYSFPHALAFLQQVGGTSLKAIYTP